MTGVRWGEQPPLAVPRALALAALTCPAVAVAHLATTGTLPPWPAILAAAAVAAGLGALVRGGALALALAIGLAQLAGHAVATLLTGTGAGCLPDVGRGAAAGVELAVLSRNPACPPGSYAAGPLSGVLITAVVTALAVLIGHAVLAAVGGLAVAAVQISLTTLRALAALVRPLFLALAPLPVAPTRRWVEAGLPVPGPPAPVRSLSRRGPPVPA